MSSPSSAGSGKAAQGQRGAACAPHTPPLCVKSREGPEAKQVGDEARPQPGLPTLTCTAWAASSLARGEGPTEGPCDMSGLFRSRDMLADWQTGASLAVPGRPEPPLPTTPAALLLIRLPHFSFAHRVRLSLRSLGLCPVWLSRTAPPFRLVQSSSSVHACCFSRKGGRRERKVTEIGIRGASRAD